MFELNFPENLKAKLLTRKEDALKLKKPQEKPHEAIPQIPECEKNPNIQSASNCIEIQSGEGYGRQVVATRDIKMGEVLSVEKPFGFVMFQELYVHCHECSELCYNLIPCKTCTEALYCSETCRVNAWESYHQYECPICLSLCHNLLATQLVMLPLRILFKSKINQECDDCAEEDEMYRSDRYKEVANLLNHLDKMEPLTLFMWTLFAAQVFNMLKEETDYLDSFQNMSKSDAEDTVKELLLTNMGVYKVNSVFVDHLILTGNTKRSSIFGSAIYPFYSMFNHSCFSNTYAERRGSSKIVLAKKSIKKGDQCFINYG